MLWWQASDAPSTGRVLKAIVQLCFDTKDWEMLNEHVILLTKKRSQLKTVSVYRVCEPVALYIHCQGRIEPPKVARGHVTSVNGKIQIALFIECRYYY